MAVLLAAIFAIAGLQGMAEQSPPPLVLPPGTAVKLPLAPPPPVPLDTSYLTLTKKAQLWGIFTPQVRQQFWIADFKALKLAWDRHELVDVSDIIGICGMSLRKSGKWPIAEKDLPHRGYYYGLRPAAAGLLLRICDHMQGTGSSEVTSLVRSWKYQLRLMRGNPTANVLKMKVPPTHVFGLAFDITRMGMPLEQQKILESYLAELTNLGVAIYFKETHPQSAFHVIALPQAHAELAAYYETVKQQMTAISLGQK
ncbi:MAG: hypothetical protein KW788_02000 [Candidatus Doudnabacteria bacterium]|nr:hypothetical protein [Candidatus Doudnabacteria bacterium]